MSARTTYDEVRYSNFPYAQTHPDRLATVGALHGLRTPDPSTARVLEIGCGAGGNLIAMATATPGITAVGVDLAETAVAEGRAAIEAVGIGNVELRQGDVSDLRDGQLGDFDYVIAHGVYAWIPEAVRDHLLEAIHSHLTADGLAYISYNANPGGYMRRALRDMGYWYAGDAPGPLELANRAQALYRFVWDSRAGTKDWWGGLLESQLDALAHGPTHRLVHDELSEFWAPAWFADVMRRAGAAGLSYVGDADLATMLPERVPAAVAADLDAFARDRLEREQLIDILRCVFFRMSVLCRDSLRPVEGPLTEALRELSFAPRPGDTGAKQPPGLLGSALALLRSRAPDTVPFSELRAATGADPDELCDALRDGFLGELVMPHRAPLQSVAVAEVERPLASPLARWQARTGAEEITSMAYTSIRMDEPAARLLLGLLDGTRDREAIRADFLDQTGVPISPQDLDANLDALAKLFLLADR
jgi:SAM-dependent methyltransferase